MPDQERKQIAGWQVFLLVIAPALFGMFAFAGTVFVLLGWNPYIGGSAGMIIWILIVTYLAGSRMEHPDDS